MSQASDHKIPDLVQSKLIGLRLKMTTWLFVAGCARLLPTVLGLIAFVFVVDYMLEMDVPQRIILSSLCLLVIGYVAYSRLLIPLTRSLSDDALVLEVEKQNRHLSDSLISAVQFSRDIDMERQGISPAMVNATIEQGTRAASEVNFGTALDERRYFFNIAISATTLFLLGAFVFGMINNETMRVFADRIFFYGQSEYAKNTYLEFYDPEGQIQDGVLKIYRGQDCKLVVRVREDSLVKDVTVKMYYRDKSSSYWVQDDMRPTGRFDNQEFEIVYKAVAVEFEAQARGGDGRTSRLKVELEEPPQFSNLRAEVFYPDYAVDVRPGDKVRVFESEKVYKYVGSDVGDEQAWELQADVTAGGDNLVQWELVDESELQTLRSEAATRAEAILKKNPSADPASDVKTSLVKIARQLDMFTELEYAQKLNDELGVVSLRSEIDRLGLRDPSDTVESVGGKLTVLDGCRVQLTATANTELAVAQLVHNQKTTWDFEPVDGLYKLNLPAEVVRNGTYQIRLRDETLREPPRSASFEIDIQADQAPEVKATLKGISGLVINRARLPFTVSANDDFRVVDIYLKYSWQNDAGDQKQTGEIKLNEYEPVPNWEENKPDEAQKVSEILPIKSVTLTQQFFDLGAMDKEDIIPPGAGLNIVISARDNDNVPEANVGSAKEFLIRVVTEEEFRADLLRREKEARQEFDLIYKRQKATQVDTEALAADSRSDDESIEEFLSDAKSQLSSYSRNQRLIGENIEGVISRMEDLLTEGLNNRLDETTGEFETRYTTGIIGPMQTITDELMLLLKAKLDQARRDVADEDKRSQNLFEATEIQNQIIAKMEEILQEMEKNEGLQEIINKVFETKKEQARLKKITDDERRKRIKNANSGNSEESGESSK